MDTFQSPQTFLSPRKSLLAVGVTCALLVAGLLAERTASPTQPDRAGSPTHLRSNPELASPAPLVTKERTSR